MNRSILFQILPLLGTLLLFQQGLTQSPIAISVNFKDQPLAEVFAILEKKYPLSFSYDDALVRGIRITAKFKREPLEPALRRLLTVHLLDFDLLDNRYVLIKKIKKENSPPLSQQPESPALFTHCGRVVSPETGEPLPGAFARLSSGRGGAVADAQGQFHFTAPWIARDSLTVSCLGYEMRTFALTVPGEILALTMPSHFHRCF